MAYFGSFVGSGIPNVITQGTTSDTSIVTNWTGISTDNYTLLLAINKNLYSSAGVLSSDVRKIQVQNNTYTFTTASVYEFTSTANTPYRTHNNNSIKIAVVTGIADSSTTAPTTPLYVEILSAGI